MPVCGVIFFELDDCWGVDWIGWGVGKFFEEFFDLDFVLFADFDWLLFFTSFVFFISLNFYFFGYKFLWNGILCQTSNNILIALQLNIKHKSKNIRSSLDKLNLKWIMKVKGNNFRCSLQPRPERFLSLLNYVIFRECME